MTDLHKPLGQDKAKPTSRAFAKAVPLAVLGLLFAVAALLYQQRSARDAVVVSLNDTTSETTSTQLPATPQNSVDAPTQPKSEPDVQSTQPKPVEQPNFKPKQATLNRQKAWLPVPELIERSEFGPLPKVSTSGLRPIDAYSERPAGLAKVRIAIVLGGMGISQTGTKNAIETLPSGVTLAFSPIGNSLNRWMQLARKEGHEVGLQLPMEPLGYPSVDPGRWTLLKDASVGKNVSSLRSALGRMTNYPFVMSYLGAAFTSREDAFRPILSELKDRGVGWLDDGSVQTSKSLDLAEQLQLPHAAGNIVIDARRQGNRIAAQLQGLELLASRRGYAIGSGTVFPETVKAVKDWIVQAEKKGIQIVPVSSLMKDYSR